MRRLHPTTLLKLAAVFALAATGVAAGVATIPATPRANPYLVLAAWPRPAPRAEVEPAPQSDAVPAPRLKPSLVVLAPPPTDPGVPAPRAKPQVPDGIARIVPAVFALPRAPGNSALADPEIACAAAIAAISIIKSSVPAFSKGACGIAAPLKVSAVAGGVRLRPEALVSCQAARAFSRWVEEVVVPAAREHFGTDPVSMTVAASYHCRGRNGQSGGRLSEHAFGSAIDISAIRFADGTEFKVGFHKGDRAAFQKSIRSGACGVFTTVLGPGSDSYHSDHLHMDLAKRRNGSRYCK